MTWPRTLSLVAVAGMLAASPAPSATRKVYVLGEQQVAAAVSTSQLLISSKQIQLLATIVATQPSPRLDVVSAEAWGERRSKVRIACHEAHECLPFWVAVNWPDEGHARSAIALWEHSNRNGARVLSKRQPPVLRAGQAATMVVDSGRVHLQLPVICLESGAVGRTIRVSSRDHKQVFAAEVVSSEIVKGKI